MTSPTIPVRTLNVGRCTERRPVRVDPAFEAGPTKRCWSCTRHLAEAVFPDPGVRCLDCMVAEHRDGSVRIARGLLRSTGMSAAVRRLVVWRCLASGVARQAELYDIDLTTCPLPEPGRHRKDTP